MRKAGFLLFGLVGATLLSQFPEYFQQYVQRLGGRLDEVTAQVTALDRRAAEAGKPTADYIRGLQLHRDADVRREGTELRALVQRRVTLADSYQVLTHTDRWWRAGSFAEHFDWDVAASTLTAYQPGVPVTAESAVYSGAGFGSGAILFITLFGLRGRRQERRY